MTLLYGGAYGREIIDHTGKYIPGRHGGIFCMRVSGGIPAADRKEGRSNDRGFLRIFFQQRGFV